MHPLYGIGNPLLDALGYGDSDVLTTLGYRVGTMNLVDRETQSRLLSHTRIVSRQPGGSCANVLRVFAWLQGTSDAEPVYTGSVGEDEPGDEFRRLLIAAGVTPSLGRVSAGTGRSLIYMTPDKERTMFTHLGACVGLLPAHLDRGLIEQSRHVHVTGYVWDSATGREAALEAIHLAREMSIPISFDVSDPLLAERHRDDFFASLSGKLTVLFANEQELATLSGSHDRGDMLTRAAELAETVVLKLGKEGCIVRESGGEAAIGAEPVDPVDTSGAGDSFAGAFLYGRYKGADMAECARLANFVASRIVERVGCDIDSVDRVEAVQRFPRFF